MAIRSANKRKRLTEKRSTNKRKRLVEELPDEIVLSILSRLSLNEAARSSLVCRKWNNCWRHLPVLDFDNPMRFVTMVRRGPMMDRHYPDGITKARVKFIDWVDHVLNNHLGCVVDEFRIVFYFNILHQEVIDRWVLWVFSRDVQRLELHFAPPRTNHGLDDGFVDPDNHLYVLDLPLLMSCNAKFNLTSLCLKNVDVTTQAMEYLLNNCGSTLENLCIHRSNVLTRIGAVSLPVLKYLELRDCPKTESIDIKAPKLVSLNYYSGWYPVLRLFKIDDASMLTHLSIKVKDEDLFFRIFRSLFKYFPHLEFLKLSWLMKTIISPALGNFPVLANLKHLKLFALLSEKRTFEAWIPFIGACPLLQKLTLKLRSRFSRVPPKIECHDKCPLLCLKTIEIKIFNGVNVDLDIANFVLQNAPSLQEVILHVAEIYWMPPLDLKSPLANVGLKLPPHVNLVVV